ncbi:hypothetical protein K435DRAFT_823060 [Dendrothele bispora CBS 962.96]|uniref:NCS1 nucleoside transporter family n=1 Tax=Dendrothele bispora (strain CBS 962.96) TaxID=1314807 RepID=A0A4V4HCE9_DENBC|nr:hypothetical protein K435DRAFT_823060 [Dendrothele bispora CBS 962.96]
MPWAGMSDCYKIRNPTASRFTWGMRGAYPPVIIRTFTTIFWDELQAYWGGQASVTLGSIITGLAHMDDTLAGGILLTKDLIGMILYYIFFISIMAIPPERLQKPFIVSSILFGGTLIGLLAWAVYNVHGVGPMFEEPGKLSDWTRYANRPCQYISPILDFLVDNSSDLFPLTFAPTLSQLIAAPVTIIVTGDVGIIVTSCADQIVGEVIWQPFELLARIQDFYGNSPKARAGVFFAGLGCVCAQLGISIVLNSVSAGMDMAGLQPKYLNIRRGAYILAAAGILSNPWQYLSNASTLLTVLSGFGIFLAAFTGIILADYLVIRRCIISLPDVYIGNSSSIYWYFHGFHWRALIAWVVGVFPTMPGFVMSVRNPETYNPWVRTFNIAFFVGLFVSFTAFWLICKISLPPGVGLGTGYHEEDMRFGEKESSPTWILDGVLELKGSASWGLL